MSNGKGKEYRGQQQIIDGSLTGEPIVVSKIDYNAVGDPLYYAEAKFGSEDDENRWVINKILYDSFSNAIAIQTALNKASTLATSLSVDTVSQAPNVLITIVGGDFQCLQPKGDGDRIMVHTGANSFTGILVQKLDDTNILVNQLTSPAVNETGTAIDHFSNLLMLLESPESKDFAKRRWDKRSVYIYG